MISPRNKKIKIKPKTLSSYQNIYFQREILRSGVLSSTMYFTTRKVVDDSPDNHVFMKISIPVFYNPEEHTLLINVNKTQYRKFCRLTRKYKKNETLRRKEHSRI